MGKRTVQQRIKALYFSDKRGALTSPKKFGRQHPEFSKSALKQFFESAYTPKLFFPKKKALKKYVQKSTAYYFGDRVQADLAFIDEKTFLIVADVYTKFLSTQLVSSKHSEKVAQAFKDIYGRDYSPFLWLPWQAQITILSDDGSEFKDKFKALMKTLNIEQVILFGGKAILAERMIGVVKRRVRMLSTQRGKTDPEHFTRQVTTAWNDTPMDILGGATPRGLRDRDPNDLKSYERVRGKFTWEQEMEHINKSLALNRDLKPGIWVRISANKKNIFQKGSERESNKLELFQIQRLRWPSKAQKSFYPYAKLIDYNREPILGEFRVSELILSKQDPTKPGFRGLIQDKRRIDKGLYQVQLAGE